MVLFSFYVEVFVENACVCIRLMGPTYVVVLFIWLFAVFTVMLLGWSSRLSMWIKLILSYLILNICIRDSGGACLGAPAWRQPSLDFFCSSIGDFDFYSFRDRQHKLRRTEVSKANTSILKTLRIHSTISNRPTLTILQSMYCMHFEYFYFLCLTAHQTAEFWSCNKVGAHRKARLHLLLYSNLMQSVVINIWILLYTSRDCRNVKDS